MKAMPGSSPQRGTDGMKGTKSLWGSADTAFAPSTLDTCKQQVTTPMHPKPWFWVVSLWG